MNRDPFLGQPKLEFSGVRAHIGGYAEEPFISDIGGAPRAMCISRPMLVSDCINTIGSLY
jgi:hypothetical protein